MGRPAPENLVLLATGDGQWEGTTQDFSFFGLQKNVEDYVFVTYCTVLKWRELSFAVQLVGAPFTRVLGRLTGCRSRRRALGRRWGILAARFCSSDRASSSAK